MKWQKYLIIAIVLALTTTTSAVEQSDVQTEERAKMAILPFNSIGVDRISVNTAEQLLEQQLFNLSDMEIIPMKEVLKVTEEPCSEVDCAIEIGDTLDADQVLLVNLSRLGEKIIVQYMLVDVLAKDVVLRDYTSTETIGDLETIMKRIALSVKGKKPFEKSAEVGAIIEKETEIPRRREARKLAGLSLGYLYPQNGYDDVGQCFTLDARIGYEMQNLEVGGVFAIRKGIALNVYAAYLFTKTDFCPYVGGALGFHWVEHEDFLFEQDKRSDGYELVLNTGIRAFRTYNFRVLLNLEYTYTLNDYNDQAIVFTIGLASAGK